MAISNFSGKVAFVTGAASKRGMGHAIALRLAAEGADVAIHSSWMLVLMWRAQMELTLILYHRCQSHGDICFRSGRLHDRTGD